MSYEKVRHIAEAIFTASVVAQRAAEIEPIFMAEAQSPYVKGLTYTVVLIRGEQWKELRAAIEEMRWLPEL